MVVCDYGEAIIIAVAHVLAECANFKDYLRCYQIINYVGYSLLPTCFIRLDISHFVKMLCRWPCLSKALPKAREFTIKTVCYVYKSDNFKEVAKTLECLLVLLSKEIGHFEGGSSKLKSEKCLEKIDRKIKTETFEKPESDKLRKEEKMSDEYESEKENDSNDSKQDLEVTQETITEDYEDELMDLHSWKTWSRKIYVNGEKRHLYLKMDLSLMLFLM